MKTEQVMERAPRRIFEIVTYTPTSGKICITHVDSVAVQTGLSLTWSQTQYLCQHACGSTLHAIADPEGGTGGPDPLENHTLYGFL